MKNFGGRAEWKIGDQVESADLIDKVSRMGRITHKIFRNFTAESASR